MAFKDVLRKLRQEDDLTQEELAAQLKISKSTISMYENGNRQPDIETLEMFADFFNVNLDQLIDRETENGLSLSAEELDAIEKFRALDEHGKDVVRFLLSKEYERMNAGAAAPAPVKRTRVIPLFGTSAAAGPGEPDTGNPWVDYEIQEDVPGEFAVRITGDSMEPLLHDGQVVLCKKDRPDIGDLVVVMVNGCLLCKQFCTDGKNVFLLSLNRKRRDCDYTIWHNGQDTVKCWGTVILKKRPELVKP